jgi:DNA-binding LytR/AlgR family response regulator
MKVVIIEDETPAANRLTKLLRNLDNRIEVIQRLDSVEASVKFFETSPGADLVFMDIQLADGLSFDIFSQTKISLPVIFTTAFDQYTLKAFKVNSVDYLLKPIVEAELQQALAKHKQLYLDKSSDFSDKIIKMVQEITAVKYKERLLIKRGQQLSFLKTDSTAYCYADGKLCYAVDFNNTKYLLETNLSELEQQLQPDKFYRINRSLLVNIDAVKKVHTWMGGRLKLELFLATTEETVVSRERVNGFKDWLGQ